MKDALIKKLNSLKRDHYDGCANTSRGNACDCGADEQNAEIDTLVRELESLFETITINDGILYVRTPQGDVMFPGIKRAWKDHETAKNYLESLGFNG